MLKLVRFHCGCIGTEPINGLTNLVCVASDDRSEHPFLAEHRVTTPGYTAVSQKETDLIVETIHSLIMDGVRYRELKSKMKELIGE